MQPGRRWGFWLALVVGLGSLALGIGVVAGGRVLSSGGAVEAAGADCSLSTLQGAYLFTSTGYVITGNNRVPLVYAGHVIFDGKGGVQNDNLTQSLNGVITQNVSSTGSYTVDPDCSGVLTINGSGGDLHLDLFIAPDGSDFTFIRTDPGSASAGWEPRASGKRVGAAGSKCSLTTLRAPYLFSGDGFQIVGNDREPVMYSGHTMFDGKGGVHDNVLTRSLNGVITRHITSTGSYTVAPDCSGTLTINGVGGDLHYDLFIAPDGSLLNFIGTDPGSASAGWEPRAK